jgi:predicted RNase H-like HicB family nuclease
MSEIIFEVREDEVDGGYTAHALGYGIHTQGDTVEELRAMVKDAVRCYFDETWRLRRLSGSILCAMKFWPDEAASRR